MFWTGEQLERSGRALFDPFAKENIDCSSYHLSVGSQIFVTSEKLSSTEIKSNLIDVLDEYPPGNLFRISPGQFAFILTEERVTVPDTAIAFNSMRAKFKFKGLINVSGFHVDPGWDGKLIFSVYNAGPAPILITRGEKLFLILYANLSDKTTKIYEGRSKQQNNIPADMVSALTSQVFSPQILQQRLAETEQKMGELQLKTATMVAVSTALLAILGFLATTFALTPALPGLLLGKTIEAAGYELKQKPAQDECTTQDECKKAPDKK